MKTVSLHFRAADFARQGDHSRNAWQAPVKTCVETGNLRHIGEPFGDRFNRCQIVRLVQRGQAAPGDTVRQGPAVSQPLGQYTACHHARLGARRQLIARRGSMVRNHVGHCVECIESRHPPLSSF